MPNNRSGSRVGRWGATLLVALVLAGASHQAAAAVAQQTATPAAQQTPSATAPQPASAIAQQTATSKAAGGDDFAVIPDPTQPSTQTAEVISPDSPPAQAPGIAELVAALPPFTIQHFPPDVLLNAANPAIAPDAVQVAKGCAPSVPDTPPLVPLQRHDLEKAQANVDAAKQGGACLEAIMQKEAQETGTIQVDTLSLPQDRIGIPEDVPVAVNPTIGAPAQEDISAPKEVQAAAAAAQNANQPGQPGEEAAPVFTPLVPDGVGCDAHQLDVLQARASKVSVEAELLVIEYILQQCP